MATLVIKNVPDALHTQLKRQAEKHRRSLAKEALTLLERAVTEGGAATTGRRLPEPVKLKGGSLTIAEIEAAIAHGRE